MMTSKQSDLQLVKKMFLVAKGSVSLEILVQAGL